jgi:hypothetical protein
VLTAVPVDESLIASSVVSLLEPQCLRRQRAGSLFFLPFSLTTYLTMSSSSSSPASARRSTASPRRPLFSAAKTRAYLRMIAKAKNRLAAEQAVRVAATVPNTQASATFMSPDVRQQQTILREALFADQAMEASLAPIASEHNVVSSDKGPQAEERKQEASQPRGLSIRDKASLKTALPKWSRTGRGSSFFDYLRRLETQFRLYKVPVVDYPVMLSLLMEQDFQAVQWIEQELGEQVGNSMSWDVAKAKLLRHFERDDYVDQLQARYLACSQSPTETVQMFAERFSELCGQLGYADDNQATIDTFLGRLNSRSKSMFYSHRAIMLTDNPDWQVSSLHALIQLCTTLDVNRRAADTASESSAPSARGASGRGQQQQAMNGLKRSYHEAGLSDKATNLHCDHHPYATSHRTSECRQTQTRQTSAGQNSSMTHPARAPSDQSNIRCFQCNRIGHKADKCPDKAKGGPSPRTGPPTFNPSPQEFQQRAAPTVAGQRSVRSVMVGLEDDEQGLYDADADDGSGDKAAVGVQGMEVVPSQPAWSYQATRGRGRGRGGFFRGARGGHLV